MRSIRCGSPSRLQSDRVGLLLQAALSFLANAEAFSESAAACWFFFYYFFAVVHLAEITGEHTRKKEPWSFSARLAAKLGSRLTGSLNHVDILGAADPEDSDAFTDPTYRGILE